MSGLSTGMELDAEQQALVSTVTALFEKRADSTAVRAAIEAGPAGGPGFDTDLWETLVEQIGVAALIVPEEYDGVGASLSEAALVLEQLGAALAPTPLLSSLIATSTLLASGDTAACAELLPEIAAGTIATVAFDGATDRVLDGDQAEIVLSLAGGALTRVDPVDATWVPTMDQTIRLARLASTTGTALTGDAAAAAAAGRRTALVGIAALATGAAQRALDLTVSYSKERVQFGRTIGSYQALKHRMADMLVLVETSRSASWAAARGLMDPADAAQYCTEALSTVAGEMIQLHGGIAITWEHDAHLVFKRAHSLRQLARAL